MSFDKLLLKKDISKGIPVILCAKYDLAASLFCN